MKRFFFAVLFINIVQQILAQSPEMADKESLYQRRIDHTYNALISKIFPSPSKLMAELGKPARVDTQAVLTQAGPDTNQYLTFHFDSLTVQLYYEVHPKLYSIQKVEFFQTELLRKIGIPLMSSEKSVISKFGKPITDPDFFPGEFHYFVTGMPTNTLIFAFSNHRLRAVLCQPYYD